MKIQNKFKQTEIGMIPEEWSIKKLSNITKRVCVGFVGPCFTNYCDREQGIPMIRTTNLTENGINFSDLKYVTKEFHSRNVKSQLNNGDIVIARHGDNGKACLYEEDFTSNCLNIVVIKTDNTQCDSKYLLYSFKNSLVKNQIDASIVGSVQGVLNTKIIAKLEIPYPALEEQSAIAKIFSDLDSKIKLNQQMNQTLEETGKVLFNHWFIDFEFPNEEGKPYISSGGEMVYNEELGKEIPKGWTVGKLGDFISVERGLSYKGSGLCKEGIPMINLGNVAPNNHFRYEGLKFYSGGFKERNLVKPGDLIIANTDITQKREVLGSCLIVPSDLGHDKILFTHHIYAVRHKNGKEILPKHFLSYLFQNPQYRERATGFATGTTVLALPEDAILNFYFAIPNERLMNEFDRIIRNIKNKNSNNITENKNLSQIHDSLLPKLMSGRIRVPVETIKCEKQ